MSKKKCHYSLSKCNCQAIPIYALRTRLNRNSFVFIVFDSTFYLSTPVRGDNAVR